MKKISILSLVVVLFFTTNCTDKKTETPKKEYASFGAKISETEYISAEEMLEKYKNLKENDTLEVAFASTIDDVCQKKGCWMTLALPDSLESFVKFKDYGFFVPMNAMKSNAIVHGKAFISVETVQDLKHYAKDEGLSQAEIDEITEPEVTYSFLADGVLIEK